MVVILYNRNAFMWTPILVACARAFTESHGASMAFLWTPMRCTMHNHGAFMDSHKVPSFMDAHASKGLSLLCFDLPRHFPSHGASYGSLLQYSRVFVGACVA